MNNFSQKKLLLKEAKTLVMYAEKVEKKMKLKLNTREYELFELLRMHEHLKQSEKALEAIYIQVLS